MVTEQLVTRRKNRAMAQTLEEFERDVEPHLPEDVASRFKATVRRKLHNFASDITAALDGMIGNGVAEAIKDSTFEDVHNRR